MPDNSFDIVSKIDLAEVANAIQQAMKEVSTRFDLKDSKSQIAMEGTDAIMLHSSDEYKMKAVNDILQAKASIQADVVRISGKDRDTLQDVIAMIKGRDFGIDLQFTNYRTN